VCVHSTDRSFTADYAGRVGQIVKHTICLFMCNSRGKLSVVDQVLEGVAAAELVQQAGQVADDGGGIRGVDVPRDVADLHQREVPIGVGSLTCGDLR